MTLTFGSLFAGIGGLDLGLERAGMQCAWQVEIDDYATRVLERHWPHVRRWRDITDFPPDTIRAISEPRAGGRRVRQGDSEFADWQVDLICGGFPCQDISYAGTGAGLNGSRSGLFWEAMRVIRTLGPKYVLLENVAALLSRGLPDVLGSLASIGYDAEWHCLQAADFGAPHIRDRVFIIGQQIISANTNERHDGRCVHGSSIANETLSEREDARRFRGQYSTEAGQARRCRRNISDKNAADTNSEGLEKWQGQDTSGAGSICGTEPVRSEWWSVEPDVGRVAHGVPARMDRLRGLGNAVVPQVAEYIGRMIVAQEYQEVDK